MPGSRSEFGIMSDVAGALKAATEAVKEDRVVELTRMICGAPTPDGKEGAVAEIVAEALDRPGIELHLMELVPGRPNVIARVKGTGERPPLVLNGHMDAHAHPGPWSHDPLDPWIENERVYGFGITDMLGAVAAMVAAVEVAPTMGPLPGDLILQAVIHHDTIGLGTKYVLASEGPNEGYAICGEPSGMAIHTGNGGALKWEVRLRGETAHISRQELAADALAAAVDVYNAINVETFDYEPSDRLPDLPRLVKGQIQGGFAPGSVADEAFVRGDLRYVPGMDRYNVKARIKETVDRVCPDNIERRVMITAVQNPFMGATEGKLIDSISEAHTEALGCAPRVTNELPGQAFITDAADLARAGLETVVYGIGQWHDAPDQFVEIEELVASARISLALAAGMS